MAARTTPKTAEPTEVEYDFDNWDQDAEDKALLALNDVKYIIVEKTFVGRFSDGEIVKIPLTLSSSLIEELEQDFTSPMDQFKHLLRLFVGDEFADTLDQRSMIPVAILTEKFFRCIKRAQELAFPES
jgi:hypothetical protein